MRYSISNGMFMLCFPDQNIISPTFGLCRQLDQAYIVNFKGPGSRGSQARTRVDKGMVTNRPFLVRGLPESCLDPGWVMTLTELQRTMFDIVSVQYDYTFPNELLERP